MRVIFKNKYKYFRIVEKSRKGKNIGIASSKSSPLTSLNFKNKKINGMKNNKFMGHFQKKNKNTLISFKKTLKKSSNKINIILLKKSHLQTSKNKKIKGKKNNQNLGLF